MLLALNPFFVSKKRIMVKCKNEKVNIDIKDKEYQTYKEMHDPEYFKEDFYGLRKVCSPKKLEITKEK